MDFLDKIKTKKISTSRYKSKEITEAKIDLDKETIDAVINDIYKNFKEKYFAPSKYLKSIKDSSISIDVGPRVFAKYLVDNDIIEGPKASLYKLSPSSIAKATGTKDTTKDLEVNTKAKNVNTNLDKAVSKKAVKYKVPASAKGDAFDKFFREVYQNMKSSINSPSPEKMLLKGRPGSGKCLQGDEIVEVLVDDELLEVLEMLEIIEVLEVEKNELNKIQIKIKDLFKGITKLEKINLELDQLKPINSKIKILNENNEFIDITDIIIKEDYIKTILFDDIESKTALNHHYIDINAKDINVGDVIQNRNVISTSVSENKEIVYDMTVNSERHLYKTANGIIHHNTSSISQLATLFGMTLITIEGAHISEEDIINIPYVVTKGFAQEAGVSSYIDNGSEFEVQNADSALVTLINNTPFIKDEEHLRMLNKNKLMKKLYNKYEKFIKSVRRTATHKSGFKTILFVDEYFRVSDKKIQNLLRTILNGNIGCWDFDQVLDVEIYDNDFKEYVLKNIKG